MSFPSTLSRRRKVGNYLGPATGELPWPRWPYSGDIPWPSTGPDDFSVAPRAGAWIETQKYLLPVPGSLLVAPRAGAWIETLRTTTDGTDWTSPPARGRGLKPYLTLARLLKIDVAPRAGAWIETVSQVNGQVKSQLSPPARGRGLKRHRDDVRRGRRVPSPPARGRGLKRSTLPAVADSICVAPRAGAWIETSRKASSAQRRLCRPPRGGVD